MVQIKKGIPLFSKKIFHFPFWIGLIAISFLFGSCHPGQMKFSFLKLDSADLMKYYNDPKFGQLVFQFVIPDLNSNKKNVKLVGYAMDANYNQIGDTFNLKYSKDSASKVFEGPGIYGNLQITQAELKSLIKPNGNSLPFNYLLFAPEKDATTRQIFYTVYLRPIIGLGNEKEPSSNLNPSPPAKPSVNSPANLELNK
jgi:hypothetical protein